MAVYWVLDGYYDVWQRWALRQVNALHAAGRMFEERDHVHTLLYDFRWEHRRDPDGVPVELALDHPYRGFVPVFIDRAESVTNEELWEWLRTEHLPDLLPGTDVVSLSPRDDGLINASEGPDNTMIAPAGTSFSAAIVSGVAALVRAHFPDLTAHQVINRLADEGLAVVVISSYLPEVMNLSDRILVCRQGRIVEEFSPAEASEEKIMYAAVH